MNERQLEIIVRSCPEAIFGTGFELVAQQLSLPSGRIDLLLKDSEGARHVVELKKGRATNAALQQVLAYSHDLACEAGAYVTPWVVSHEVPQNVAELARAQNIRTLSLSTEECFALCKKFGITDAELIGARKGRGILSGGGSKWGLRNLEKNSEVFAQLPLTVSNLLRELENKDFMDVASGGMQTVVFYRCCKLGGYNRQHRGGHFYLANGVVIQSALEKRLSELGFSRMAKVQKGSSHEHVWWEIDSSKVESFAAAVSACAQVVDQALGVVRAT
jgi:hypothetical protein